MDQSESAWGMEAALDFDAHSDHPWRVGEKTMRMGCGRATDHGVRPCPMERCETSGLKIFDASAAHVHVGEQAHDTAGGDVAVDGMPTEACTEFPSGLRTRLAIEPVAGGEGARVGHGVSAGPSAPVKQVPARSQSTR